MTEHQTKNTAAEHMEAFYRPFQEVKDEKFDGLVITGAPIEHLPFEEVTYWDELREVMDWTQTNVHSTFGVCWGGMAMAYHFHGIPKHMLDPRPSAASATEPRPRLALPARLLGRLRDSGLALDRDARDEIEAAGLKILLGSDEVGPCLVEDAGHRALYIFNHFEYDSGTLKEEYDRDVANGTPINVPRTTTPTTTPRRRRSTAGAATRICSTATGSTRSTSPPPMTSRRLADG
jgi:homoserine O-succinyltransferase/O-acetyltransferase